MTIDEAIKHLRIEYEKAQNNPTVHTPLAYALYHTWRLVDSGEKRRKARNDT